MRALAMLIVTLALVSCALPRDGRDGMDGAGVAAGLRHTLAQPNR